MILVEGEVSNIIRLSNGIIFQNFNLAKIGSINISNTVVEFSE